MNYSHLTYWALIFFLTSFSLQEGTAQISNDSISNYLTINNITAHPDSIFDVARYEVVEDLPFALALCKRAFQIAENTENVRAIVRGHRLVGHIYEIHRQYDSAVISHNRSMKFSVDLPKDQADKAWISTAIDLAIVAYEQKEYQVSLEWYQKAIDKALTIGDLEQAIYCYYGVGLIYENTFMYDRASEWYYKALTASEEENNDYSTVAALQTIALLHVKTGDEILAEELIDKALRTIETSKDPNVKYLKATHYSEIGSMYLEKEDYEQAKKNLGRAIQLFEVENDVYQKVYNTILWASACHHLEQPDSALLAIDIAEQQVDFVGTLEYSKLLNTKGKVYAAQADFERAIPYFKESLDLSKNNEDLELQRKNQYDLFKCYQKTKRIDKALEYHIEYVYTDSILTIEEKKKSVAELGFKYQISKKEKEIEQLEKQRQRTLFGGIFALLLGLIGVLLYFNRIRAKNNKVLVTKNEEINKQYQTLKGLYEDRRDLNEAQKVAKMGNWVYDYQKQNLSGSKQLLEILNGFDRVDVVNQRSFLQFLPKEHQITLESLFEENTTAQSLDISFSNTLNNRIYWFNIKGRPVIDKVDNRKKFVGTLHDITETVEYEERITNLLAELQGKNKELELKSNDLIRSNQDLEQFASVASHDLQEPLRMVGNFAQLLEEEFEASLDEEGKMYINYIVDGVTRMSVLIKDLLQYSKIGRAEMVLEPYDPKKIVDTKLHDLSIKIQERNAEIIVHDLPHRIHCAPNQLSIVFYNLINNGIKFNRSAIPTVSISSEEQPNHWLFKIEDNGIGIDPKNNDKIFEIFKRLHRKEEFKGTGIGLALAKRIVLRHRGEIWLESALGKGTIFFFTIPK